MAKIQKPIAETAMIEHLRYVGFTYCLKISCVWDNLWVVKRGYGLLICDHQKNRLTYQTLLRKSCDD